MAATAAPDVRAQFPTLQREGVAYLDSAATSQTPEAVLAAMDDYYRHHRASVHRGVYPLAAEATQLFEGPIDDEGLLDLDALDRLLPGAKVLAVAHVSNVLGTINPIADIARRA